MALLFNMLVQLKLNFPLYCLFVLICYRLYSIYLLIVIPQNQGTFIESMDALFIGQKKSQQAEVCKILSLELSDI